jgi:predicted dehydrogenase/nucleoside-diphosphate-sugar epimerase
MLMTDTSFANRLTPGRRVRAAAGRFRVALVGAGNVARVHAEILRAMPAVALAGVCDVDRARADRMAAVLAVPGVASLDALGDLDIDLAHVLVPPDAHVATAGRLLDLGIGVFVEKPVALSSADVVRLAERAEALDLPFGVNHNMLFHPTFLRLRDRIESGRIGRLQHVRVVLSVPLAELDSRELSHWMFRAPGNIVFEQAVHPISMVHALVGRIRAAQTTRLGTRELRRGQLFHDRWIVAATAERGTAEISLSFGQDHPRHSIEVVGTDGDAEADLLRGGFTGEEKTAWLPFWDDFLATWRRGTAAHRDAVRGLVGYVSHTVGCSSRTDPYFAGMRASVSGFYRAVADGTPPPVGGRQAAEVIGWCEAVAAGLPGEPRPSPLRQLGPPRAGETLVIGGTGFIGRRVVDRLLERDVPVTLAVRRARSLSPELEEAVNAGRVRIVEASLEDRGRMIDLVDGAAVVVHLATGAGDTWPDVKRSMVDGSVALAEAALVRGVRRFVYVSSISALYAGHDRGGREIDDDAGPDPSPGGRDLYSRGKIATELALGRLHRDRGLRLVIVRPGIVLGPGAPLQHGGLGLWVRDNHCIGWGLGRSALPLVAVDDVAEGIVRVAMHPDDRLDGAVLNLASRVALSARDVVEELGRVTGRRMVFHPRPLWAFHLIEIGKWVLKMAIRRPDASFPSYRDLKTRALPLPFTARTARELLGWTPIEDRETFLDRAVRWRRPQA